VPSSFGIHLDSTVTPRAVFFNERVTHPSLKFSLGFIVQSDHDSKPTVTYLCLADIRWVESEVWITTPSTAILQSRGFALLPSDNNLKKEIGQADQRVMVDSSWADSIFNGVSVTYPDESIATNPSAGIRKYCKTHRGTEPIDANHFSEECEMITYSMILTDSIRRVPSVNGYTDQRQPVGVGNTELYFQPYHQVHAYKIEGVLLQLAWTVLIIHAMLVR
jgi:hypothetical protein